jgi:tRNA A37 methylthiotransferase MiaB
VDEKEAARRVDLLLDLARRGRRNYARRWAGREVEALIQGEDEKKPGQVPGISDNYLRLLINMGPGERVPPAGTALSCRLAELPEGGGFGNFDLAAAPVVYLD